MIVMDMEVECIIDKALRDHRRIINRREKEERKIAIKKHTRTKVWHDEEGIIQEKIISTRRRMVEFGRTTLMMPDGSKIVGPKTCLVEDGLAFRKARRIEKRLARKASRREKPLAIIDGILEWEYSENRSMKGNQAYLD